MLKRGDISALKAMRERVQELERRLTSETEKDFPMGRLAEACRAVDDSILQILVLACVHNLGATEEDLRLRSNNPAA